MSVSWRFTVPGQPPSVNHSYKIVRLRRRDGTSYQRFGKISKVADYQEMVAYMARAAQPMGWVPEGLIRVRYWMYVSRDIDCDNVLKAINDGLKWGLGVDDKRFLPCVVEKHTKEKEPRVEIEVIG
jgi:Holliday junction resolvase RusA-like endonuclease